MGTDIVSLLHSILQYREASAEQRYIILSITEWLENYHPTCAVYWTLMSSRLLGMEKKSSLRFVRIVNTRWNCFAKCILLVTGSESKYAFRMGQIYRRLEAGIEGGIHTMRLTWQQHWQEDGLVFLLIDAHNSLNENNQNAMMWAVTHERLSGAKFTFICYHHLTT